VGIGTVFEPITTPDCSTTIVEPSASVTVLVPEAKGIVVPPITMAGRGPEDEDTTGEWLADIPRGEPVMV
jgi:hypothetical protein